MIDGGDRSDCGAGPAPQPGDGDGLQTVPLLPKFVAVEQPVG